MSHKQQLRQPNSIAGLVKYEDEKDSLIKIKPMHVVGICVALVVMELVLYLAMPI
ncbi:MAG: preprotein translocase subunit Sec61beta [Candidatus Aenigmarchaeota archaeon]|nr:preprotein translocase subunit Sec61beta [Candidatus Aenigmarchaeota archaeon]